MIKEPSGLGAPVRLHPLSYLEDGEDVVIGRTDTDSYGVFPADGAALLRRLADGEPPGAAARWYAETYGEPVDLAEFLGVLAELDFLVEGDSGSDGPGPVRPPRWQRLGRALFSPPAWAVYGVVLAAAAVAMVATPRLVPHNGNVFFTQHLTVLMVTLFLGQFPLILIHEAAHALAGRRLGVRSRLRVARRLFFVVFETSLDGLIVVPRKQRYLPILVGMFTDLLVLSVLTLVAAATLDPAGRPSLVGRVCLALAFTTFLRFCWQFYFHLRTDLYQLAVTALGCQDLQAAAKRVLGNHARRLVGRPVRDTSGLHPRDLQVARWYCWPMLAGYTLSTVMLFAVGIPVLWRSVAIAGSRFAEDGGTWLHVADSTVFLALTLGQFGFAAFLAVRSRARRRRVPATSHLTT
ncbi:hypothetical protein [Longispora urticae]